MNKGVPFRTRLVVAMAVAVVVSVFVAPVAMAQSPDDIPGFDQLPIPGGEDPAEDPTEDPGGDPGTTDPGPQVDAPGGGVDTGAGGLAEGERTLPLAAAGAVAAMGGATLIARRRAVRA